MGTAAGAHYIHVFDAISASLLERSKTLDISRTRAADTRVPNMTATYVDRNLVLWLSKPCLIVSMTQL